MEIEKKVKIVTLKPIVTVIILFLIIDLLNFLFTLDKRIYLFELLFLILFIITTFRLVYFSNEFIDIISPFGKKRLLYNQIKKIEFKWNWVRGEEGYCLTLYTSDDEFLVKRFLTKSDYDNMIFFFNQKKLVYKIINKPSK